MSKQYMFDIRNPWGGGQNLRNFKPLFKIQNLHDLFPKTGVC